MKGLFVTLSITLNMPLCIVSRFVYCHANCCGANYDKLRKNRFLGIGSKSHLIRNWLHLKHFIQACLQFFNFYKFETFIQILEKC
jgi:hypothetical protein